MEASRKYRFDGFLPRERCGRRIYRDERGTREALMTSQLALAFGRAGGAGEGARPLGRLRRALALAPAQLDRSEPLRTAIPTILTRSIHLKAS